MYTVASRELFFAGKRESPVTFEPQWFGSPWAPTPAAFIWWGPEIVLGKNEWAKYCSSVKHKALK